MRLPDKRVDPRVSGRYRRNRAPARAGDGEDEVISRGDHGYVSAKSGAAALYEYSVPGAEAFQPTDTAVASKPSPSRFATLFLLFSVELIALMIAKLPETMSFENFAFCDRGANLTLQYLVANGLRPAIDFGYHYGLLPILIARGWFAVFGASPTAYQLAMLACNILFAWALAKIITRLQVGGIGLALAIIALGFAFQSSYPNLAQALEAVLLCVAIAEQARGSRNNALALATVAVFSKQSMGYAYGLLLAILIVRDLARTGFTLRRLFDTVAPATVVFIGLATTLSVAYGARTFLRTILPIEGATAYHSLNFGLTGSGRPLWDPKGLPWIHYLVDASGLWIASSACLFGGALFQLSTTHSDENSERRSEIVVTCAILHLAFLTLFFGNQWSWIYYSYLPVIGCAIAVNLGPVQRRVGLALCAIALLSWTSTVYWSQRRWQTTARDIATAGLWATPNETEEWSRVLTITRSKNAVLMSSMGAAELLFPGFEKPVSLFLMRGLMTASDVERKTSQLSSAQMVVVPVLPGPCDGCAGAPEFSSAMKSFGPTWTGQHLEVLERRSTR